MATYRSSGVKWGNVFRAVTPPTHQVGRDVERNARRRLARHNRSGRLLGSLRMRPGMAQADVLIGTDHWRFIEYGTPPHEIRPRVRQALSWPRAAHPVRRVRHPGTEEYAPMRRALIERKR